MCQMVPWESFQCLLSLTYNIELQTSWPGKSVGNPSKTIFSGPSRLPQLQHLHVNYYTRFAPSWIRDIYAPLDTIYRYDINRTIEDSSSFPCLQGFHAEVKCKVTRRNVEGCDSYLLDEDKLVQLVVDRLPAVFGSGGRKETQGWITSIVSDVWRRT